jgi:alpha-L-fucosidase
MAKNMGAKYVVLTTRHHEGFSLWNSKVNPYNSYNYCGRDIVQEFVDACREYDLKIGFYSSLMDWHHPDSWRCQNDPEARNRFLKYIEDLNTELLTNYGKIDILWFDFSFDPARAFPQFKGKGKDDWESEKLIALARELQPGIMIDNRADIEQDINTPEQFQVDEWPRHKETGELLTWEACHTFSGSWGYHRDEMTWKSPEMLIEMLCKTVALGGNLLMNVGPCARGYFDKRATNALAVYGEWMKYNSRSIYGCTMAEPEFKAPSGTVFTQSEDGKRLYLHLFSYPYKFLKVENLADKIDYAQFLHDGSEIKYSIGAPAYHSDGLTESKNAIFLNLPEVKPDVVVPVIELLLK